MILLAQLTTAQAVFLVALAVVIGILLMRSQRHYARRESAPMVRVERPQRPAKPALLEGSEEMARWEVRMHDTARDLSAQLDSKMGALMHLVHEADRAAARLETALAAIPPAHQAQRLASQIRAGQGPRPPEGGPAPMAERAGLAPDEAGESPAAGDAQPVPRRYDEIYTLADYGLDPTEIAQRVAMPVGEVQLILSLRGKR
jgi:hypothetical protein